VTRAPLVSWTAPTKGWGWGKKKEKKPRIVAETGGVSVTVVPLGFPPGFVFRGNGGDPKNPVAPPGGKLPRAGPHPSRGFIIGWGRRPQGKITLGGLPLVGWCRGGCLKKQKKNKKKRI